MREERASGRRPRASAGSGSERFFRLARAGVLEPGPVAPIDGTQARIVDGRVELRPHVAQSLWTAGGTWSDSLLRLRREGVDLSDAHDMSPPTPAAAGGLRGARFFRASGGWRPVTGTGTETGARTESATPSDPVPVPVSDADPASLLAALRRAVLRRLPPSDPVPISLSGGLDSPATATLAANLGRRLRVYTLADDFAVDDDPDGGELARARRLARSIGAEHVEVRVTTAQMIDAFPRAVVAAESEIFNPKGVASILFLEQIPEPILLSGTGADEVLTGTGDLAAALAVESRPAARRGLELRLPYLDLHAHDPEKKMLRAAVEGLVLDEIRLRPKTRRYAPPDPRWDRAFGPDLRAAARAILKEALA